MKKAISKKTIKLMTKLKKKELSEYVSKAIISNDTRKVAIIKQAHLLGCDLVDPYVDAVKYSDFLSLALCLNYGVDVNWTGPDGMTIAHICAMTGNDILLKSLILRGLEINKKMSNELSPLQFALFKKHYDCARELINNNAELIWTTKKCKVLAALVDKANAEMSEEQDDDSTEYASFELSVDISDVSDYENELDEDGDEYVEINALTIMYDHFEEVVPTNPSSNAKGRHNINDTKIRDSITELILSKLDRLHEGNYDEIRKLVLQRKLDLLKIVLSKYPRAINKIFDRRLTLLSMLIEGGHVDLVNELIQKEETDLSPNILRPYLHILAGNYDIVNIRCLLDKNPDHVNKLCEDFYTAVDHLLMNFEQDREDEIIEILNILVSKGCNLNNRNDNGSRTIETAIQYSNAKIIKRLVDFGINIHEDILDGPKYLHPNKNNDILAFAAQMGNVEMLKVFLEHNVHINLFQGMPTALLLAIKCDRKNAVIHLMSNDKIKSIVNEQNNKKNLLDYSINTGAANKKIMLSFSTSEHIDSLKLNVKQTILNNFEKNFSDVIEDYDTRRYTVLLMIDLKLHFLMQCALIKSIDNIGEIINVWVKLCTFRYLSYYNKIDNTLTEILIRTMNKHIICASVGCMDFIKAFYLSGNNDDKKIIYDKLISVRQLYLRNEIKKITSLQKLVESCQGVQYSNERYSFHYTNSDDADAKRIDDILIRLMYPVKQPHYESMHSKLTGINCVLSESDSYISVHDNDTGITATVFRLEKLTLPKRWFDFYCHNIGKVDKCDFTHMFPFILDKKIRQIQCSEKSAKDNVNGFGDIHMIYFYGNLRVNNKSTLGVFEYFIDSTQTLFHRFFRPYAQLSPKWQLILLKNIPEILYSKIELE